MMGGYEGGYPQYHAGYEDRGGHGAGLQWPGGYHGHHHSQGSPTQRYPYYDSRSGYYAHSVSSSQGVTADPGGGSWHEPVSGSRSDSPGPGSGPGGYPAPTASTANMYSCKMQTPPSPQDTKVRPDRREVREELVITLRSLQMEGAAGHPAQYPGYTSCGQSWNNNLPPGHVQNSYSLAHGQPSPLPPGGPQGGPGSAPVPSPLYPWMRSQFGKLPSVLQYCSTAIL